MTFLVDNALSRSSPRATVGSAILSMSMMRHDDSQRSDRLAVTQPMHPSPCTFLNRENN